MAASIAASSNSKSAVNGTPTNCKPCKRADMSYITKPGTGASTLAPGTSQAMLSSVMISSEPLPRIRS